MPHPLIDLGMFAAKTVIIFLFILLILLTLVAIFAKGKKTKGRLVIKNLNEKYEESAETILLETLSKKDFKHYLKNKKKSDKEKEKNKPKTIYVINFHGDIKASAVEALREEVTDILNVATPQDEVFVRLESQGGVVHGYGLATAQLLRIRERNIPLIISVDKVAASGGYMMACVANKILAAPFAILGSIGVIVQLPNFHRLLEEKNIDFEQYTAGEFKRTITLFGKNTEEGRQKLQHEIEDIHQLFKNLIHEHRPQLNIHQVATGEHWMGLQALSLNLVDEIKTSDDYLLERSKEANLFEICYEIKKPMVAKLLGNGNSNLQNGLLRQFFSTTNKLT